MTIAAAYLAEVKQQTWVVHYIDSGKNVSPGDTFNVIGREREIDAVVITSKGGDYKKELVPIDGTLKVEATRCDELTFSFKFESDQGTVDTLLMRFHFFKADKTVFRFIKNPQSDDNNCEKECDCCCCDLNNGYVLYSTYDDGDRGGGGPHGN